MNNDYRALPLSRKDIFEKANALRGALGLTEGKSVPIVKVIEYGIAQLIDGFNYRIVSKEDLPGREAVTYPAQNEIVIREDTYSDACAGETRARFTLGHELGHLILHPPWAVYLAEEDSGDTRPTKPFKSPEWQADAFAGEFLAPVKMIIGLTIEEIMERFRVSYSAAKKQSELACSLSWFRHCRPQEQMLPGFVMPS